MTLEFRDIESPQEVTPRIVVFGAGGAGGNAVNTMISKALEGVEFVAANTDAQALAQSRAAARIQLGGAVTQGLGVGGQPDVGALAAEESVEQIAAALEGAHMCFVAAGMGGGTGTGSAPVIARIARRMGVLTVGVVTKPFDFEGKRRMRVAEAGLAALEVEVDTLIVIPNQNLFRIANDRTPFSEAFTMADEVLYQGVKGVTDLMVNPGLMNLDFNDVRAVMDEMGKAMMGAGEAEGEKRALEAAERAIDNPLLDGVKLAGARGVLINITGGDDLTMFEVDEAANRICKEADPDAKIFVGTALDPGMNGRIRVSVVATGIGAASGAETGDATQTETVARPDAGAAAKPAASPATVERKPAPEPALASAQSGPRAEPARPAVGFSPSPLAREGARPSVDRASFDDAADSADAETPIVEEPPNPQKALVRKLTGDSARRAETAAKRDGGERPERPEGLRVEIPSFLRRQV